MLMRSRSDCLEARGRFDRVGRFLPGARGAEKSIHRMAAEKAYPNFELKDHGRPEAARLRRALDFKVQIRSGQP